MINIEKITKSFKNKKRKIEVLDNLNFKAEKGEFITIFGPNGCGKTTLLYLIAGISKPDNGIITVDNKVIGKSKIGFVFQNYDESLFPWRTVLGNVQFALETQGIKGKRIGKAILKRINIEEIDLYKFRNNYVYELSGGMKQLTAIARTLAFNPDVFLMDEPFSSLDYSTTLKMEEILLKMWRETKKTILFVSHSVDEAIYLADRVIILTKKPTKIAEVVKVDLPRPRKLEIRQSKEFFRLRNKVLNAFKKGMK